MFTREEITEALNRWNDDVIADPGKFQSTAQIIMATLHQRMQGQPVTYGDEAFETLFHYINLQRNTDSIVTVIHEIGEAIVKKLAKKTKPTAKTKAKPRKRR